MTFQSSYSNSSGKQEDKKHPGDEPDQDNEIPVPPGEKPPEPINDPPSPIDKAPIDEGPKGPKIYVSN